MYLQKVTGYMDFLEDTLLARMNLCDLVEGAIWKRRPSSLTWHMPFSWTFFFVKFKNFGSVEEYLDHNKALLKKYLKMFLLIFT